MVIVEKDDCRCSGCAETTWNTEMSLRVQKFPYDYCARANDPNEREFYLMIRGPCPNSDARVRPG